jgi:hypothetical protein
MADTWTKAAENQEQLEQQEIQKLVCSGKFFHCEI